MSTALNASVRYLNALAQIHHRGRGDTWAAARDRAAKAAGIDRSYAKRIWDRWQTMRDVSGEAYMRLRASYQTLCEHNELAAERLAAERAALRGHHETIAQEPGKPGLPEIHARD